MSGAGAIVVRDGVPATFVAAARAGGEYSGRLAEPTTEPGHVVGVAGVTNEMLYHGAPVTQARPTPIL